MMNVIRSIFFILLIAPLTSQAQDRIRCESDGGGFKRCGVRIERGDEVRIQKRLSKAQCRQGESWGIERGGIWVDRGCRADFQIIGDYRRDSYQNPNYRGDTYVHPPRANTYSNRNRSRGYNRGYDNRYNGSYDDRLYDGDLRSERRRLEAERRKLEAEKRAFEQRRREERRLGSCRPGSRIGRCSKKERARGCKDWKEADQTPCKSGG